MGHFVQTNVKALVAQWDVSGDLNACALEYGAELQDGTTFGKTTRTRLGGLKTVSMSLAGLGNISGLESGQAEELDQILFESSGVADKPVLVAPENAGADGELAFALLAAQARYQFGGAIGAAFSFQVTAEAAGSPLVRGTVMHNGTRTASGNGTARQLGAISATQKIYAALHVLAASGATPTLDVKVQSDDNAGMLSPTDRITFAQKTALGSEWKELAGAVIDDYWRLAFTIGGGTPSFSFIGFLGIQ